MGLFGSRTLKRTLVCGDMSLGSDLTYSGMLFVHCGFTQAIPPHADDCLQNPKGGPAETSMDIRRRCQEDNQEIQEGGGCQNRQAPHVGVARTAMVLVTHAWINLRTRVNVTRSMCEFSSLAACCKVWWAVAARNTDLSQWLLQSDCNIAQDLVQGYLVQYPTDSATNCPTKPQPEHPTPARSIEDLRNAPSVPPLFKALEGPLRAAWMQPLCFSKHVAVGQTFRAPAMEPYMDTCRNMDWKAVAPFLANPHLQAS